MPPKKSSREAPLTPVTEATPAEQLKTLLACATHDYAIKDYASAADLYSRAVEVQTSINGEMAPENADLLYLYGRALYHVAVSKSDVLGGQVAQEKKKTKSKKKKSNDATKHAGERSRSAVANAEQATSTGKPYFQIEGDDADWDTDEEDDNEAGEDTADQEGEDTAAAEDAAGEEADDDFTIAFEILDTARVLLSRQITEISSIDPTTITSAATSEAPTKSPTSFTSAHLSQKHTRTLLDRLADVHDLQSEISLENENFGLAITDARASLALKTLLYPFSSNMIAEMHLKLALALEMAAQTTTKGAEEDPLGRAEGEKVGVDDDLMAQAVTEMETAIASTKERVQEAAAALPALSDEAKTEKQTELKGVEELLADLEARLVEMRAPPQSMNAAVAGLAGVGEDPAAAIRGILGGLLGQAPEEQKKRIEEARATANDLTGMVKRKKPAEGNVGGGKRKADEVVEGKVKAKRARVEDAGEEDELA
jgi:HAT1-interacting factor 1